MGSFAATCAISGLPIEFGNDIRILLLTRNPYETERPVYMHGVWFPRTYPLRAKYNDYGGVEEVEEGPARDIWLEGFKQDLVPVGWGDNSVHDVPTSKDMSWDELMAALWENRVQVQGELRQNLAMDDLANIISRAEEGGKPIETLSEPPSRKKPKAPEGVPTRQRIERAIVKAGFGIRGRNEDREKVSFMVNKVRYGIIRVRMEAFSSQYGKDIEFLKKLEPALSKFATVITAGSGNYAGKAEMLVFVKPNEDFRYYPRDKRKPLPVQVAMIREDVWQALLTMKAPTWEERKILTFEHYKRDVEEYNQEYEALRKTCEGGSWARFSGGVLYEGLVSHINRVGRFLGRDVIPFTVGLATHWHLMRRKGPIPPDFMRTAAEFAFIHEVLSQVRYYWRPGYTIGPQFGEWGLHTQFFKTLTEIAGKHYEEACAEMDPDED